MTLRECYANRDSHYPELECKMKRIMAQGGLNSLSSEAIGSFCNGTLGNLRIDSAKDYENILGVFWYFVTGAVWELKRCQVKCS